MISFSVVHQDTCYKKETSYFIHFIVNVDNKFKYLVMYLNICKWTRVLYICVGSLAVTKKKLVIYIMFESLINSYEQRLHTFVYIYHFYTLFFYKWWIFWVIRILYLYCCCLRCDHRKYTYKILND